MELTKSIKVHAIVLYPYRVCQCFIQYNRSKLPDGKQLNAAKSVNFQTDVPLESRV